MLKSNCFKLAVICGGPSLERGISLNSARSVMDHLKNSHIEVIPIYVDSKKRFYRLSPAQLYSNNPSDFDFKLSQTAISLDSKELDQFFKSIDLVFPVIHGAFGEDGELQALLESYHVPFVGHSSACCKWMFRKDQASEALRNSGFATLPQLVISNKMRDYFKLVEEFFQCYSLTRAIVKPTVGGSSIGVFSVETPEEACLKLEEIFEKGFDSYALLEPFCQGSEFTIVVFENLEGEPVALIPTEVEVSYASNGIFDYRKKYLPTNQAAYHTPPRFSEKIINHIRMQAEEIFKLFGMRDFVRLDGWVIHENELLFTDINPVSGLEQNSFLFRQASVLGFTHSQALRYIINRACQRYGLSFPIEDENQVNHSKKAVYVLFGGHNAERQVSLMSGTNVWLKLLQSQEHAPIPFYFDHQGGVWQLPYSFNLNHTVEEIYSNCLNFNKRSGEYQEIIDSIQKKLGIEISFDVEPHAMTLDLFLERAKKEQAFVFIAMHGGEGENGTLQKKLEAYGLAFNGSNSTTSALCMDKYLTGEIIRSLSDSDIEPILKKSISLDRFNKYSKNDFEDFWSECCRELSNERLIIKPRCDGCSAGIVLLQSSADFERYCHFLYQKVASIPPFSFANQAEPVEMPTTLSGDYLLEPYIDTDIILIEEDKIKCIGKQGWIELTVGVLEEDEVYYALNPSITIAEGAVLSLEEKFQGGTGVNLTPPPIEILSLPATNKIRRLVEKCAQALKIQNYARLDVFFNRLTEKLILIEANTLPALTPSTVIYHQGLAEDPPITPLELLDKIIMSKSNHY